MLCFVDESERRETQGPTFPQEGFDAKEVSIGGERSMLLLVAGC